jgi:prepilin-type processing-associated H-X9-DG protein
MPTSRPAFARVELLALLILLAAAVCLLPAAGARVRRAQRQGVCPEHLHTLTAALATMTQDDRFFPPSYAYGASTTGIAWNPLDQHLNNPIPVNGYVHWSGILLARGYVNDEVLFTCPSVLHGGAPAANPGPVAANWEPGQINDVGSTSPATLPHDRQAARMAYTANAAVLPRNNFLSGSVRSNVLLKPDAYWPPRWRHAPITQPARTTILTEFLVLPSGGWSSLYINSVCKSHRPITPFLGRSAGPDVYSEPDNGTAPHFMYPTAAAILPTNLLGPEMINDSDSVINAVGRHHTGETANFAFIDGSVRLSTPADSVRNRLWGDRFYTITGNSAVQP